MRLRAAAVLAASLLVPAVVVPLSAQAEPAPLTGVLRLAAGACSGGAATGSYFRMILANGSPSGPFLANSDSTCDDETYTLLRPGTDGGLRLNELQPQPTPAFDRSGNARAARFIRPVRFYGVDFSAATNPVDPQTGTRVPAPVVRVSGATVTADLRAVGVTWNNQVFNQGAPKPDGSTPGNTRLATGRYDSRTGELTLQWTSQIQGGPFNGFTGLWHLTGTVSRAAATSTPSAGAPAGGSTPNAGTTPFGATSAAPSASPSASSGAPAGPTPTAAAGVSPPSGATAEPAPSAPVVGQDALAGDTRDQGGLGLAAVVAVGLLLVVGAGTVAARSRWQA